MTTSLVLFIIGLLLILDALFVFIFKKTTYNLMKKIMKRQTLTRIATIEIILGVMLIILSAFLRTS